jgi:hypothetical protein
MTMFVLLPSLALFALLAGHVAHVRRGRRRAREAHDDVKAIEWAGQLRHMRDWRDITGEVLPSPVPPSGLTISKVLETPSGLTTSKVLETPSGLTTSKVLETPRPRRLTLAHIVYASLVLAALELVSDIAARRWPVRRVATVDPGVFMPTAIVTATASTTIVSHRAGEPSRLSARWVNLRAWPLEPVAELERWWRTTHHTAKHALGKAPGATAQRARWNAATGAWAVVRLARLGWGEIKPSPLRLRPAVPRELEAVPS